MNLINFLLRRKKEHEAVTLVERTAAGVSKPAAVAMLLAAAHVSRQNGWHDGEQYLQQARTIDPESPEAARAFDALLKTRGEAGASFARVSAAFSAKRYEDALSAALEGVRDYPQDGRFGYYAALACANLDKKAEALAHLEAISDPNAGEGPWFLRAALLRELGKPAQALEAIERVTNANPANVDAALVKASLLETLQRCE